MINEIVEKPVNVYVQSCHDSMSRLCIQTYSFSKVKSFIAHTRRGQSDNRNAINFIHFEYILFFY